jgi:LuxR family maltose regulon positive regulatory protein
MTQYDGYITSAANVQILSKPTMFTLEPQKDSTGQWKPIVEKIAIPSPTGCVSRRRLTALLEQSLSSCTSTVISGRAGSGKTTLAIDFAEKSGRAIAWYKVDAPESKLEIFFSYLVSSIRAQRPGFGSSLLSLLHHQSDVDQISHLAELFVFELERQAGQPLLIVIEDLHLVCDADWLVPFFRRLLPLLPADVHMLITSRTMPPAPLWRMRSKQTLAVIEEDILSFTRDEAVKLFAHYGLTPEQASIAFDHCRGRAAALSSLAATLHFAETELMNDSPLRQLKAG